MINPSDYLSDIALITLSSIVPFNTSFIQTATLPTAFSSSYPPANTSVVAIGRVNASILLTLTIYQNNMLNLLKGTLAETGSSAQDVLYNVRLTVYDPSYCGSILPQQTKDWNSQICAGNLNSL